MKIIVYLRLMDMANAGIFSKLGLSTKNMSSTPIKGVSSTNVYNDASSAELLAASDVILCNTGYSCRRLKKLFTASNDYLLVIHESEPNYLDLWHHLCLDNPGHEIMYCYANSDMGIGFDLMQGLANCYGTPKYNTVLNEFRTSFYQIAQDTFQSDMRRSRRMKVVYETYLLPSLAPPLPPLINRAFTRFPDFPDLLQQYFNATPDSDTQSAILDKIDKYLS